MNKDAHTKLIAAIGDLQEETALELVHQRLHDGEDPLREQDIAPFHITPTTITNQQFAAFVRETGYLTEAERFGWSFVHRGALASTDYVDDRVAGLQWWCKVRRADWLDPTRHARRPREWLCPFGRRPCFAQGSSLSEV